MDFFAYYASYYAPDPPPPDKENLTAALREAVRNKDLEEARDIFDRAFWNNIRLTPDWHMLLVATALKDKAMVRLLATHGAGWTKDEALSLKEIYPLQWPAFAAALSGTGVVLPRVDASQKPETAVTVTMMYCLLSSAKDDPKEMTLPRHQVEVEMLLSRSIVRYLNENQPEKSVALLRLRHPSEAVDFSQEFKVLLAQQGAHAAITGLDTLRTKKIGAIKPIEMDAALIAHYPDAVPMLDRRDLLAYHQPGRMLLIHEWFKSAPGQIPRCRAAASVLFKEGPQLTETEADTFIKFHQQAVASRLSATDDVCGELKKIGFFDAPVWTKERLGQVAGQSPDGSSLKDEFNRKQARERFEKMEARKILKPENVEDFLEAHRKGYYQASARQTSDILALLNRQYASGIIPSAVREGLRTLKESGAHFSNLFYLLEGSSFLGKKEPGMAKILLELDILKPNDFFMTELRKKAGLPPSNAELYWEKYSSAYTEFFFQVTLERRNSEKFIPQRGKIASYHEAFKDKIFGKNPPRKPPPPRRWFWEKK